jgi:hypothetical protein
MNRRIKVFVTALVASGITAACSHSSDTTAPSGPANIAGAWVLSFSTSNSSLAASQDLINASVSITQTGSTFTGQSGSATEIVTVSGASTTTTSVPGPVTGGQINGASVQFTDGACAFTGTATGGSTPNSITGNVSCTLALNGQNYPFTGTWSLTR